MLKTFLATMALSAGLGLSLPAAAGSTAPAYDTDAASTAPIRLQLAQHRHSRERASRPAEPQSKSLQVPVHEYVRDEVLPLRRMLGIDGSYRGYQVQSVLIEMKPRHRRARMHLLTNGRVADRQTARNDRFVELTPGSDRTLGYDLGTLTLEIEGKAYIKAITVTLAPRPHRDRQRVHHRSQRHGDWPHGRDGWQVIFENPWFQGRN